MPGPSADGGRNDAFYTQFLPAETVRFFALVAGVAKKPSEPLPLERLMEQRIELDHVRFWPAIHHRRQYQMALNVAERRELGIPSLVVSAVPPTPLRIMDRDVARLKTGRVNSGGVAFRRNQAAATGQLKSLIKEPSGAPFFSNRSSA